MALLIELDPAHPSPRKISQIVEELQSGGVIVYPTDTVYGIGCSILQRQAIERVYRIRRLDRRKPLAIICSDLSEVAKYAQVSNAHYRMLKIALPGPYTFILPATPEVPRTMLTKRREMGVRIPDNAICQAIVQKLGHPILSASVVLDPEGDLVNDPRQIYDDLGHAIDVVVDGGMLPSAPSTVVDLTSVEPVVVREGKGDLQKIGILPGAA